MQCYCSLSWQKTTCNLIGSLVTMICRWPINAGLTFVWDVHHSPHQPATLVDQRSRIWQCSGRQCQKTQPGTRTMQIKSKLQQKIFKNKKKYRILPSILPSTCFHVDSYMGVKKIYSLKKLKILLDKPLHHKRL